MGAAYRLRRARGSALKFKGACLPANKARGGPWSQGPAAVPSRRDEGRGDKWTFRTLAEGHPICCPTPAPAPVRAPGQQPGGRSLPNCRPGGDGRAEGALGEFPGAGGHSRYNPDPWRLRGVSGARARWWPGAGRAGETREPAEQEDAALTPCAPARSRALPRAQVARPSAPREGMSQGRTRLTSAESGAPTPAPQLTAGPSPCIPAVGQARVPAAAARGAGGEPVQVTLGGPGQAGSGGADRRAFTGRRDSQSTITLCHQRGSARSRGRPPCTLCAAAAGRQGPAVGSGRGTSPRPAAAR